MLVDFKNVNICQESKCVLENVNFHVDEGEFIYIIGKVGAGKSSLLKTMYCELDIESADCANVLDHNLLTIKRRQIPQLRKGIGIISRISSFFTTGQFMIISDSFCAPQVGVTRLL